MVDLASVARTLVAVPKGILAADESEKTADEKRLAPYGIGTGSEMRRQFRELLLAAPGIEEFLSGVILHEETLSQKSDSGVPFPELLKQKGIIPGIKVDGGTEPLPEHPGEVITKGLIGLPERLAAFRAEHDTGFTKWRAVLTIDGDRLPSPAAFVENAKRLASYARMAQEAGLQPGTAAYQQFITTVAQRPIMIGGEAYAPQAGGGLPSGYNPDEWEVVE